MVRKSGQQGVPVITIDDEVVVGFDQRRLDYLVSMPAKSPPFGVAVADAARILVGQGRPAVPGAYVGKVTPLSTAAKAGLRPGDIITHLDASEIRTAADVEAALSGRTRGSHIALEFSRDDVRRQVEVTL